jgi:hypothetical protein
VVETSGTRAYRFFILFFILTLAFSLTSAGILNSNTVIGIDAYVKESDEFSGESSRRASTSGSTDKSGGAGGSSSGLDTKSSSDNSNNKGNSGNNKNNDQAINDGSNRGADNNLQAIGPAKTGEQQATGDNAPSIETVTPTRQTTCKEGSNCTTYQQDQSNSDHSTTTTTKEGNTPLVLSLPFP